MNIHQSETNLSRGEVAQILNRMDLILEQLPKAKKQAHERIIGERTVANGDKILSLYESDLNVIVLLNFSNKRSLNVSPL